MFNNFTLDKNELNVVYIPIGSIPRGRAEQYMQDCLKQFEGYRVKLIGVPSNYINKITIDNSGEVTYDESVFQE